MAPDPATAPVRIWDLPVRLIHWSLVLLIPFSWWSAEQGHLDWHRLSGIIVLALVLFRLIWGFAGSGTARFAGFVRGPGAVLAYARSMGDGARTPVVGHNPMGGWSVVALLLLLTAQVSLGLFAVDIDGIESGPLSHLATFDQGRQAAELHDVLFKGIVTLVLLHVGVVLYYRLIRRDDLITPMVTGRRSFAEAVTAPAIAPLWRVLMVAAVAAAVAWWLWNGARIS